MNYNNNITPESVLATIDAALTKERAEAKRRSIEFEQRFEQSIEKSRIEFSLKLDEALAKSRAEAEMRAAEFEKEQKALQKAIDQVNKQIGGMSNNIGAETTEYFYNSLKYGRRRLNMFGEKFDLVIKEEIRNINPGFEDEYDIIMLNGKAVCIVEAKYKADTNDVQQVLRKEKTFRANYPEHRDKKLYLALASKTFHKKTEKACKKNGIAIIKQVGDSIEIYDENLKVF